MKQLKGIDLKRACLVPSSVFASPDQVVRATGVSLAQKLAILRRWEFDARRVNGLERGSDGATMLYQVQRALDALAGKTSKSPPAFASLTRDKARPVFAADDPAPGESPCATPGVVLQSSRSVSRL